MANDLVPYSQALSDPASTASSLETTDVMAIAREDADKPTGFKSMVFRLLTLAKKIVSGIDYSTELTETSNKTITGAINEVAGMAANVDITTEIDTPSAIQTFSDGGDNIPMKSLEVAIVAQQASGTPSPSNPLSISGFSSVNAVDCGKNLIDALPVSYTANANQYPSIATVHLKQGVTYTISCKQTGTPTSVTRNTFLINKYDVTPFTAGYIVPDNLSPLTINDFTFTVPQDYDYKIYVWSNGININLTYDEFQLEKGTKTDYTAYQGTTTPVSLGQTIYGGTAELVGGNGTKEWVKVDLSQLNFQRTGSGVFYTTDLDSYIAPTPSDSVASLNIKSSIFQSIPRDDIVGSVDGSMAQRAGGIVYFQYTSASTVEEFKTAMQNVDFICKLATPTAFTFTGANIPTLSGVNNVYADSGDVNALEYFNDKADDIASMVRLMTRT